jgi:amidase
MSGTQRSPEIPEDLCFAGAAELARRVRSRELSAVEVMEAHLGRIEAVNPRVNAIVTFLPEGAMEGARAADRALARRDDVGMLHGLPVAHKDLFDTKGVRTTYGSPIFRDNVPDRDALIVERLKRAGAVTVGKTNTLEFGAGSQTFNPVFGTTRNPYDLSKTCGGSSGGAAVALACGMVPIADGSDMGGSLRNPAAFCNIVGLRPSPGRVPSWPTSAPWSPLSVDGPMARSAEDAALMLSAVAGPDARDPLSISESGDGFFPLPERDFRGVRVAWSPDLGGLPVERDVREVFGKSRGVFEQLGCEVEEAAPDLSGADEVFRTLRAWQFELARGELLDEHRGLLKDTVVWNIEEGRRLTGPRVGAAERLRAEVMERMRRFMERYEYLVLPTTQVAPFDVETPYVTEIEGTKLGTYIDWMESCYHITVTGLPAISVPGGFTKDGLPVGVQIVGRWRDERGLLQFARAFKRATAFGERRPQVVPEGR